LTGLGGMGIIDIPSGGIGVAYKSLQRTRDTLVGWYVALETRLAPKRDEVAYEIVGWNDHLAAVRHRSSRPLTASTSYMLYPEVC
jgi:hypothetical protein